MKITRFMKLKTFADDPADILMENNHNPLRRAIHLDNPTPEYTSQWLADFKVPLDIARAQREP